MRSCVKKCELLLSFNQSTNQNEHQNILRSEKFCGGTR